LTLETNPTSPLRELLCSFSDANCGVETSGWAIRAGHEFEALAASTKRPSPNELTKDGDLVDCEQMALRVARKDRFKDRFAEFRSCEERRRAVHSALPIGRMRAPTHGWLLVEGRRGHYSFCDETRAYDLATGSAYRVASCSGLVLQTGGSVDFRATDAQRKPTLEMGHLPVMALREVAWMLLLLDEVDRHVVESYGVSIPKTLPLSVDYDDLSWSFSGTHHSTSADTTLTWQVVTDSGTVKAGTVTWSPMALDDAATEHAVTLLRVAEACHVADCPEVPPPAASLRHGPALAASRLDADEASLDAAARAVSENWRQMAERQRACLRAQTASRARPAVSALRP
jgi:hypothetical protein